MQYAAWKPGIAEPHRETELSRGSSVAADQLQVVVRERVEAGQGAVIEGGGGRGDASHSSSLMSNPAACPSWSEPTGPGAGTAA
jgi:hypothetical protein